MYPLHPTKVGYQFIPNKETFSTNKQKNNDKLHVNFEVTNAKNDKEFEERFTSSRIGGGPNLLSTSNKHYESG